MVQSCVRNMGQSRPRSAAGTARHAPPGRARGRASRGRPQRAARAGHAAPLVPGAGGRALAGPQHGGRRLRAAGRRGLADRPAGRGDPGGRIRGPAAGPGPGTAAVPASQDTQLRPVAGGAGPLGVPARRLAGRRPQGADRRAERRPGLPGPSRAARAAPDAGPLPGPGPRRPRRPGEHRDLLRLRAGPHPAGDRAAGSGRRRPGHRGVRAAGAPEGDHRGRAGHPGARHRRQRGQGRASWPAPEPGACC